MHDYAFASKEVLNVQSLLDAMTLKRGFAFIDRIGVDCDEELIRVCEIPAPPFCETERAIYLKDRFESLGLQQVRIDEEGNVIGKRPGASAGPLVVISAHLDTVFPEGTDVRVRRQGERLSAPGISDNACGIATLIMLARILNSAQITTSHPVYLVGTVGEEGEGDLRGVRRLCAADDFRNKIDSFVSLDGPGLERITNRALGSRRFKITIDGPGGHSWGDFGIVNPVHALGRAVARFATYPAPVAPRTSYNVGRIEGGSSVNSIPERAAITVDIRSVAQDEIDKLEAYLRRVVELAVHEETSMRATSDTRLTFDLELIGNRPSGVTPFESKIVQTAIECTRAVGVESRLDCSSTDSNIPISLGIPAITIGAGGLSGNCHSLAEWYEPVGREQGLKRLLLLICALAGLAEH